ncbi:hypothetical protein BGZ51_002231 [Haplosporangium sp. Z 767]|nr:hypothetical protein BGZ51_002231 [Haplosporangium sp. Z 767]KAF9187111.1 hypothetical protein BGZ50_002128 [Haplosporangium sp. Z 11]
MNNSSSQSTSAAGAVAQQPLGQHGMQQSFATEFSPDDENHGVYGSLMNLAGDVIGTMGAIPCCIICPNPYKSVSQGFVGLITRFGKFYKIVDPGLTKINPITEKLIKVDIKIQIADIPQQVIMTKDNVNVQIDSVLYWHIINPSQSVFGVSDVQSALIERTQTTLRHILGMRVLQELIENREAIGEEIQEVIDAPARQWGVKVESVLIKDITFSKELQESLSSAAQAKRMAESKVIGAQAEVDSAKLMRAAADILNTPAAMQIRYLETMTSMAKGSNTRVIFMPTQSGHEMTPIQAHQLEQMGKHCIPILSGTQRKSPLPMTDTSSTSSGKPEGFMSEYMSDLKSQDLNSFLQQNQPVYDKSTPSKSTQTSQNSHTTGTSSSTPSSDTSTHAQTSERQPFTSKMPVGAHPLPSAHAVYQKQAIHTAALGNCADLNMELSDCLTGRAGTWWDRATMCMKAKERLGKCCQLNKEFLQEKGFASEGNTPAQDQAILDYADDATQKAMKEE